MTKAAEFIGCGKTTVARWKNKDFLIKNKFKVKKL